MLHFIDRYRADLSNESIAVTTDKVRQYLSDHRVSRKDTIRLTFLIEEALMKYQGLFGTEKSFDLLLIDRKKTIVVKLTLAGISSNPLSQEDEEDEFLMNTLPLLVGDSEDVVKYSYKNNHNILTCVVSTEAKQNKLLKNPVLLAAVLGLLLALGCRFLRPEVQDTLIQSFAAPILKVLLGMLSGIMGPVVFLSVLSSFVSLNNISTLNSIGSKIIRKMIFITCTAIIVPALMYLCVYRGEMSLFSEFDAGAIVSLILEIFPVNLFKPFVENNVIQIVMIAGFAGVVMILTEKCSGVVADAIFDLSVLSMQMMKYITKLTPIMIFLSVYKLVMILDLSSIVPVLKIIALIYISGIALLVAYILSYHFSSRKSGLKMLSSGRVYGTKAFALGSGSAVIGDLFELSEQNDMDQLFAKFYIPMSVALTSTGNTIFLVCSAFFMAEITGSPISITWFISLFILCFELTIATPGGNGGVLVTVSVLVSQLGMGQEYIGLLAVVQILCANFMAAQGALIRYITLAEMNEAITSHAKDAKR